MDNLSVWMTLASLDRWQQTLDKPLLKLNRVEQFVSSKANSSVDSITRKNSF